MCLVVGMQTANSIGRDSSFVFAKFQGNLILENIQSLHPVDNTDAATTAVEYQKAQTRTIPT